MTVMPDKNFDRTGNPGAVKPNPRNRPPRNLSLTFVLAIIFIFIAANIVRSVYDYLTTVPIGTETVKMGSIDVPKIVTGIIVRDERVYFSPADGVVSYAASEFDRLKKGSLVCSVDNAGELEKLLGELGQVDERMKKMQDQRQGFSLADENSRRINAQIKNTIDGRIFSMVASNVRSVYSLKDSVTQSIDTRNQMILTEDAGSVRDFAEARLLVQEEISRNTAPVYAMESGILCEVIDGLEEVITVNGMSSLTKEQTLMRVDYDRLAPARDVSAGDPIFKIVASNVWYVAACIPSDQIAGFAEGAARTIFIEKGGAFTPVDMEVESISRVVGGTDSLVVFKCTRNMIDFLGMRSVRLKTSDSVVTGLKIPNTAITEKTMLRIPKAYVTADSPRKVCRKDGDVIAPIPVQYENEYVAFG